VADREQRLACFDRLAARAAASALPLPAPSVDAVLLPRPASGPANGSPPATQPSPRFSLSERWELAAVDKQGVFRFRPHRDNYVLVANYATSPNTAPYAASTTSDGTLSHTEVAYQLGFKMKLLQNVLRQPVDVWFGYTQNSFWQAYNRDVSRPFRETNYQPEVMAVAPLDFSAGGLRLRMLGVGLVHQSNGQISTRSRSWNRLYVQLGAERGDLSLYGRVWTRVGDVHDNPDIYRYLGHGEIAGIYRWRGHEFSALLRGNVGSGRGGVQAGWAFPLFQNLKGYAQVFSGYGASLIDYDSFQHTYGLGVLIDF
jgi:phospholipase A1